MVVVAAIAVMLGGAAALSKEGALAWKKKYYDKSGTIMQTNDYFPQQTVH